MRKTTTLATTAGLTLAAGLSLAACGSSSSAPAASSHPASSSAPAAAQPVTAVPASGAPDGVKILAKAGVTGATPDGTDVYGDAMADGTVHGPNCTAADHCGEDLLVYSNASQAALNANLAALLTREAAPGGSSVAVTGPGYIISITGVADPNSNGTVFYLSPATVAARIGGTIVK